MSTRVNTLTILGMCRPGHGLPSRLQEEEDTGTRCQHDASAATAAPTATAPKVSNKVYAVGDTGAALDYKLTVSNVKECKTKYYFSKPKKGNIWIGVELLVESTADKPFFANPGNAKITDGEGIASNPSYQLDEGLRSDAEGHAAGQGREGQGLGRVRDPEGVLRAQAQLQPEPVRRFADHQVRPGPLSAAQRPEMQATRPARACGARWLFAWAGALALLGGCSRLDALSVGSAEAGPTPSVPASAGAAIGRQVRTKLYRMTLDSVRECPPTSFEAPDKGHVWLGVDVELEALTSTPVPASPFYAHLSDSDGHEYRARFGGCQPALRHAPLAERGNDTRYDHLRGQPNTPPALVFRYDPHVPGHPHQEARFDLGR